jgi:hypothetical protein
LERLKEELADSRERNEQLVESAKADRADLTIYRQLRLEVVRVEAVLRTEYQRQNLQPFIESAPPAQQQQQLTSQPTVPPANGEATDHRRRATASGDRRSRSKTATALARLSWLKAREQLLMDRLFSLQSYKERVETTADSLTTSSRNMAAIPKLTPSSLVDVEMAFETKTLAAEVGFELRKLMEQMSEVQASISKTRGEIATIEAEISDAELQQQQQRQHDEHVTLDVKIRGIVAAMQRQHAEQAAEAEANHKAEVEDLRSKMERQRSELSEIIAGLRRRLREKMQEVHRRDMVIRKLKRQLGVIGLYLAKNMNSQV